MRRLAILLTVVFGGLTQSACDSGDSEAVPASELVVGQWTMTGLSDGSGDLSGLIGVVFESVLANFDSEGQVVLRIASPFQEDAIVPGTYILNETAGSLRLVVFIQGLGGGSAVNLDFQFSFPNSNQVVLDVAPATVSTFSELFALPLQPPMKLFFARR